jgi:hypothetical protein
MSGEVIAFYIGFLVGFVIGFLLRPRYLDIEGGEKDENGS